MKKTVLSSVMIALCVLTIAQAPEYFSYQSIVRNTAGEPLVTQDVIFLFSIIKTTTGGTVVYTEKHAVETNQFGLVNLVIGNGTEKTGSFTTIDWGADNYFLKVELDKGDAIFTDMGTTQLLSVPFALYAKTSDYNSLSNKPTGNNSGDMLYWNGSAWIIVPVGTDGQVLTLVDETPTWIGLPFQSIVITTIDISNIYTTQAKTGGNITSDGGDEVTSRGVCWSKLPNPTTIDDKTINGAGSGSFTDYLTGLYPGTTYYVRAYGTNSEGITYGNQRIFMTSTEEIVPIVFNPGLTYTSLTDIEGNIYKTIQIGTQVWMAENLRVTKYNDGTTLPFHPLDTWSTLISGAYCEYNDNLGHTYIATYGRLYNYYAVTGSHNVCPAGWHVPLGSDVEQLITFLGGLDVAGDKMRETGVTHWSDLSNQNDATNESGFTGLPGGMRDPGGNFENLGQLGLGYWWFIFDPDDLTIANGFSLSPFNNSVTIEPSGSNTQRYGLSVRCIKD